MQFSISRTFPFLSKFLNVSIKVYFVRANRLFLKKLKFEKSVFYPTTGYGSRKMCIFKAQRGGDYTTRRVARGGEAIFFPDSTSGLFLFLLLTEIKCKRSWKRPRREETTCPGGGGPAQRTNHVF